MSVATRYHQPANESERRIQQLQFPSAFIICKDELCLALRWTYNLVRKTSGEVTTVAGKRGLTGNELGALDGALNRPMGLAFDATGALLVTSANSVFRPSL